MNEHRRQTVKFYISECVDNTVMLLTDVGQVIAMFSSYAEAVNECAQWVDENSHINDESEFYLLQ